MMRVNPTQRVDMQRDVGMVDKALEELRDEIDIEIPDAGPRIVLSRIPH